jgi:ATP-dependent helicase/nuclease subunit B
MSVRFIVGRAGSGKTHLCLDSVREACRREPDGPAVLLLVPEQAGFLTSRALAEGLPAFSRARVTPFKTLAETVAAEVGRPPLPVLGESARALVLRGLVRKARGQLSEFAASADTPGFSAALAATLAELARQDLTASELSARLAALKAEGRGDSPLAGKLADLARLAKSYEGFLDGRFVDPDRSLNLLAERLPAWPALRGATVWIDGFTGFTPQEYAVLGKLFAAAERVHVCLTLDPDHPALDRPSDAEIDPLELFAPTAETYCRLRRVMQGSGAALAGILRLRGRPARRFVSPGSPELGHLETQLFERDPRPWPGDAPEPADVTVCVAANPRAEVEAAAGHLLHLVRDRGWRFRETAVILRDLSGYADLIAEVFAARGIPHFLDRRRPVSGHPLVRLVGDTLRLMSDDAWAAADVLAVLKNDLTGLPRDGVDRLENVALARGLSGAAWWEDRPWTPESAEGPSAGWDPDPVRRSATAALRACREAVAAASGKNPPRVRAVLSAVWAMLERLGVPARLHEWADAAARAGHPEEADAHRQVLSRVCDVFDEVVEAVGETRMPVADLADSLAVAMAELTIGQVPPGLDAVLVGDVERSRYPEVRAAALLGVGEGLFPRAADEDPLLDDADRAALAEAGTELAPTARRRLFDETTLAYLAMTRASRKLWVSWPARDAEGRPVNPSRLVARLRAVFPTLRVRRAAGEIDDPTSAATVATLDGFAAALSTRLRERDGATPTPVPDEEHPPLPGLQGPAADAAAAEERSAELAVLLAARDMLMEEPKAAPRLRRLLAGLNPVRETHLPADLTARLYGAELSADVRRLERFAECPFRHFARYVLRLADRRLPAAFRSGGGGGLDLVRFQRAALERFLARLVRSGGGPMPPETVALEIEAAAAQAMRDALPPTAGLSARQMFRLERSRRLLRRLADLLNEGVRAERLSPRMSALDFGGPTDALPGLRLPLAGGRAVTLTGAMARIDAADSGDGSGAVAVAVRDFGPSDRAVSLPRLFHGLSLRPAVHLMLLQRHGPELLGGPVRPVAAVSSPVIPPPTRTVYPAADSEDEDAPPPPTAPSTTPQRQRGLLVEEYLRLLDAAEAGGGPYVSPSYQYRLGRDARVLDRGRSDVLTAGQLDGLLTHAAGVIAELAAGVLSGRIGVWPFRLSARTPCGGCESRPVCRFDPDLHPYRRLEDLDRGEILRRTAPAAADNAP